MKRFNKKLNKKGFIEDFGSLVLAGILIFIIGFILVILIRSGVEQKKQLINQGISELEGTYDTRVILNYEISAGYTLSEFIVDKINEEKYDEIEPKINEILKIYYGGKNTGDWFFRLKFGDRVEVYTTESTFLDPVDVPDAAAGNMPPAVVIPNDKGEEIYVLFKKINKIDYDYTPDEN